MEIVKTDEVRLPYLHHPAVWATLASGQQVVVVRKPGDVVHLHTVVYVGSVEETAEISGISHFLEHLMFKGTARFPAGAFDRLLEGVGGRVNASTSKDITQYFVTLPKGGAGEYYHLALDLHADMLMEALLPEEEIGPSFDPSTEPSEKRERLVVIEEIKMGKDNPWRQVITNLGELLYPTHPYRREVIGTAEVIAAVPADTIRAYYHHWYQPGNMVTIITGDLPPEETVRDVARTFRFAPAEAPAHPEFPPDEPPVAQRLRRLTMPLNVGYVALGFLGPPARNLRAIIGLDVLSLILGEGLSSRIHQRLVEQLPNTPFIDAGSTHWTLRDSSNLIAYGIVRPDALSQAQEHLTEQIQLLRSEPPTEAELCKAVTCLEAQFAVKAETASGLSFALADSFTLLQSPAGYTEYLPILNSLTPDELRRLADEYLNPDHACAVLLGP
ncbi:MAG: Protease 3 precursor [bacterium ADurb.Bin429]|nr:MAG: Protease 3 precursor [bacterium ADurb.Bin429]